MNTVRIGKCSLCGGDVMAHNGGGVWHSIAPPPPPTCAGCGAVEKGIDKVIEMERPIGPVRIITMRDTINTGPQCADHYISDTDEGPHPATYSGRLLRDLPSSPLPRPHLEDDGA